MSVCESFPKKRAILAVQFDGVVYCLAGNISLKPQNNSDGICLERRIVKNDRTQIAPPGEKPSAIDPENEIAKRGRCGLICAEPYFEFVCASVFRIGAYDIERGRVVKFSDSSYRRSLAVREPGYARIDSDLLPCNGRHCRKSSHNHENTCFHGEHYTKKSLICV